MASANTQSAQETHFSAQSTVKTEDKSTNLREKCIYWYKLCCDRFRVLGKNPSEQLVEDYYYYLDFHIPFFLFP